MKLRSWIGISMIGVVLVSRVYSQDVPYIWGHSWGTGARAVSMGGAYTGISDDYTALYYNPAGLGQLDQVEVWGSFSHSSLDNSAEFAGGLSNESISITRMDGLALSVPIPTERGSLVLGFGYNRVREFDNLLYVSGLVELPGETITWEHDRFEDGGLGRTSVGGSIEISHGVFLGGGVNFWTGGNDYTWRFTELDSHHFWDFSEFDSTTNIHTSFNGVNCTFGMLFNMGGYLRIGGSVETPVTLQGEEEWDYEEITLWDDGYRSIDTTDSGMSEYEIQFPWKLRLGLALGVGPLLISGDAVFNNYSQIKYKTDPPVAPYSMADANRMIRKNLRNTIDLHFGCELRVPGTGLKLRGGYGIVKSPYSADFSVNDRSVIALGAGLTLMDQVYVDAAYSWTSWDGVPYNVHRGEMVTSEKIEARKIIVSLFYRL